MKSFDLPDTFWSQFHAEYWEKRATVLRAPFPGPVASPEEVFARLVDASEGWRAGAGGPIPEFFIEHSQLLADVGRYLPGPGDASASAWASRVTAMLDGRRFGVVVDDFQVDPDLWFRFRDFLRPLVARTGVPGEHVRATLFLGNYRRTPFGLHRGRPGSFMFVVDGRKRIRAWPDEFFRGKPDLTNRLDYEPYLDGSTVLDAEPGDVIYWPSSYWHIGEDAGGWAVAISLFVFMHDASAVRLTDKVASAIRARIDRPGRRGTAGLRMPDTAAIRGRVKRVLAAARAVTERDTLDQALIASELDHVTGFGFRRLPALSPARRLADGDCLRGDPRYPILWVAIGDGDLVCSANGRSFVIPANPRVIALLRRLNSGAPCQVGDLIRRHAGTMTSRGIEHEASTEDVRHLLERLDALRAVAVERPS